VRVHYLEWGAGDPLIAIHPLALESSAFFGVAQKLAAHGVRTLAVDLPGFGRTPAPAAPLGAATLAEPVLELARSLERRPLLLGMSLGARVALEAALAEPEAFRGAVLVVPYLPWRRWRRAIGLMRWVDPQWGEKLPLEWAWPLLRRVAETLERLPNLEDDWLARAAVRVVYYSSCPATRSSLLSAAREMALEPRTGPRSVWTRLPRLAVPATFVWAGRDALVPRLHIADVVRTLPAADHLEVPCSGHFVTGAHYRCMRHGIVLAVTRMLAADRAGADPERRAGARTLAPCLAGARDLGEDAPVAEPHRARVAGPGGGAP
jgi:pimeloyl-ACP methyl ester carboxylesterase